VVQGDQIKTSFPEIDSTHLSLLSEQVTDEEIKAAIFDMKPYYASGPDGFQPFFYQSQWSVVGISVCDFIRNIFNGKSKVAEVNQTHLVLIPKVNAPEYIYQFQPIGLCNVNYKIVSKIIVKKLNLIMPELISESQSSFIPGRNITDNIIVAQEIVHSIRKMKGRKGIMTIKVDLGKAYDRLHWDFISDTLSKAKLPSNLVTLIMKCIESNSINVLWNGNATVDFSPS
jgi:hypothetical protein